MNVGVRTADSLTHVLPAFAIRVVLPVSGSVHARINVQVQIACVDVISRTPLRVKLVGQHFALRLFDHAVVDQERYVGVQAIDANVEDVAH